MKARGRQLASERSADLKYLPISRIRQNEHNPRMVFRAEELQDLADSIRELGVQVPVSVFRDAEHYTLIDGERRWRACRMLNLQEIPAIIYPKPSDIQNIVFMFNIHGFRKDWDPLPTALKLEELANLVAKERASPPSEADLASLTGMSRGQVRRCKLILEIPPRDRKEILHELEKPQRLQRITTDLFVETQRAVRTLRSYTPEIAHMEEPLRDALIDKYRRQVINNVVHMRQVAKIARAVGKGVKLATVAKAIRDLIEDPELPLTEAYARVAWAYNIKSVVTTARSLDALLADLDTHQTPLDEETRKILASIASKVRQILRDR